MEFKLTIEDINEPPTDILIGQIMPVREDARPNEEVTSLALDDPDEDQQDLCQVETPGVPFIVKQKGDNSMVLEMSGSLDYEEVSSYIVDIWCSDGQLEIRKVLNLRMFALPVSNICHIFRTCLVLLEKKYVSLVNFKFILFRTFFLQMFRLIKNQ